jgi:hypothetical protein
MTWYWMRTTSAAVPVAVSANWMPWVALVSGDAFTLMTVFVVWSSAVAMIAFGAAARGSW